MPEMRGVRIATPVKFENGRLTHIAGVVPRVGRNIDDYTVCDWQTLDPVTYETMGPVSGPPTCLWCIVGKRAPL